MPSWGFAFRVADYSFSLVGQGADLEAIAASVYQGARVEGSDPGETFVFERQGGAYALCRGGAVLCRAPDQSTAFTAIEWALTEACLSGVSSLIQLHAGVVYLRGGAWIIPGPPESGKTSLTLGLYAAGAAVLSDEVALLQPATLGAVPFPRDLIVRHATARVLASSLPTVPHPWKRFVDHTYLSPVDLDRLPPLVSPAARLVFPCLAPVRACRRRRVGPAEAARRLLDQALNTERWSGVEVDAVARLAEQCPAVELVFADARAAARSLMAAYPA